MRKFTLILGLLLASFVPTAKAQMPGMGMGMGGFQNRMGGQGMMSMGQQGMGMGFGGQGMANFGGNQLVPPYVGLYNVQNTIMWAFPGQFATPRQMRVR